VPKDKIYYWVRQAIYNEPDDRRYSMMRRKGWTPVPVSRHPEFAIALKGKDRLDDKGVIEFGGLILCERDKRTCDKEAYERSIEDRRRVNSLSGLDGLPADHHFPVTFQNQMQGTFSDGNSAGFM
jgi:hypothetical protein